MTSDIIKTVRKNISNLGNSEVQLRSNNEALQELWQQKQQLLAEMNAAKRKAAEEAAKPYLEAITELDEMYATILALMGS